MPHIVRVLSWNLERCGPGRRARHAAAVSALDYDVAAVSEVRTDFPHSDQLVPEDPLGGWMADDERKVAIWSRWGWSSVEPLPRPVRASHAVVGITPTPTGPVRVVGVTIPWHMSSVRWQLPGREPARPWQEHESFIAAMRPVFEARDLPLIVAGDFNQRIPPSYTKRSAVDALRAALDGLAVPTQGLVGSDGKGLLCHVATSCQPEKVEVVSRFDDDGQFTDHAGAIAELRLD